MDTNLQRVKKYQKTEKGKATQKRYRQSKKGKATNRKATKKYRQTAKGKVVMQVLNKHFYILHPNHIKAHNAVNYAIEVGKLLRPDFLLCHYCLNQAKEYHHQHGYDPEQWLNVIPVCKKCHYKCDRKIAI